MKPPDLRRTAMAIAGLVATGLLASMMLRSPAPEPVVAPAPPAPQPPPATAAAQTDPAPAPPSADGLRLFGLLGLGAVIASPEGRQSFVAIGREVRPGLRLAKIEQNHVVLASAGGEIRLGFDGVGAQPPEATDSAPSARPDSQPSQSDEALTYRFGLAARRSNGRITGYALRPGADLPRLQQAGLRPGDVLIGVNGQSFDSDEKVLELPSEIAGSFTVEFEFERDGRRMRTSLQINPRI